MSEEARSLRVRPDRAAAPPAAEWWSQRSRSAGRSRRSVLFSDLKSYPSFAESATPSQVAAMLAAHDEVAAPLISKKFCGELEKFPGDAIMAAFALTTRG